MNHERYLQKMVGSSGSTISIFQTDGSFLEEHPNKLCYPLKIQVKQLHLVNKTRVNILRYTVVFVCIYVSTWMCFLELYR